MDRRTEQVKINSYVSNCIYTKQIYSLFDLPKKDESYKRITKHIENCAICNKEFQTFQLKSSAARNLIPKVSMDKDLRQSFEREVGELFKVMNLNEREILKKNVKRGFLFIDMLGVDFIRNLISKTMIKSYFFALVIFICLKMFL